LALFISVICLPSEQEDRLGGLQESW